MSERTPTLPQLINEGIRKAFRAVHTAHAGEVVDFDKTACTATIKPAPRFPVELEDGSTSFEQLPNLLGVPVLFPGAGGFRVTFPVKPGDSVMLVFFECSRGEWFASGGSQDVASSRRFHLSDAVCIPGLNPKSDAWKNVGDSSASFGPDDGPGVVFTGSEVHLGSKSESDPATENVILGKTFTDNLGTYLDAQNQRAVRNAASFTVLGTALASFGVGTGFTDLAAASTQEATDASSLRAQLQAALSQAVKTK